MNDSPITATLSDRDRRELSYLTTEPQVSTLSLTGQRINHSPVAVLDTMLNLAI